MKSFLTALAFLTVFPIRFRESPSAAVVARSRFWYPLVGLLLGLVLGGWTELLGRLGEPLLHSFLIVLAWIGLTGALHVDGFCDVCDGLFGAQTREDRLRIMKDPHLGTFGLVGGVLLLLGKLVALGSVVRGYSSTTSAWLVWGAVVISRCLVLCVAANARYPRPAGTGKALIEATSWKEAGAFAALAAGIAWSTTRHYSDWVMTIALFVPAFLAIMLLRWLCERRLGGITGDCLGAAIELCEVICLMSAAIVKNVI
jgi:adenosylcobinamide-GDP ribazoletransferase